MIGEARSARSPASYYRSRREAMQTAVCAALGLGPALKQQQRARCGAAAGAKALRIGASPRRQLGAQQQAPGSQQWAGKARAAGASLQCSASYAAAAAPPPSAAAEQLQQPQRPPLLPPWAARVVQLAAAAAAFAAWYQLAAVLGGPFASVGMAAAAPANEGAGRWGGASEAGACRASPFAMHVSGPSWQSALSSLGAHACMPDRAVSRHACRC